MKVLLAHNFYRSSAPSGEDSVYRNEKLMLGEYLDVIPFERYNDDIDDSTLSKKIKLALDGAWSKRTYKDLTQLIRKTRPDVAHFHNTFPQISPSAFAACQDNGVPVVQTLHNYRFICPNALLLREGKICEDCLGGNLWPAIQHRCYRDSLLATAAQIWTIASNRRKGTYNNLVNKYIALTSFAADKLILGGLPSERIEIKPNFLPIVPSIGSGDGGYAVYVGRLSEEKGVRTLINAWKELGAFPLKILGDGPLRDELEVKVTQLGLPVEFLGYCQSEKIFNIVGNATFQIIPSEWYEPFGMVALEGYASGTPIIASRIGSLDEIVKEGKTGLKFQAGNAVELVKAVKLLLDDQKGLKQMRVNARNLFLQNYSSESNYKALLQIYQDAINDYNDKLSK